MSDIVGVIFPIPKQLVNRLFLEKRNVFAKYTTHVSNLKIAPKHKVLFYVSHSSKEIVGEGRIEDMRFLTPSEALEAYGKKLFLNEDELRDYTLHQPRRNPSKEMLVLVLCELRKYSKPTKFRKPITMAGQYLTQDDYTNLLG